MRRMSGNRDCYITHNRNGLLHLGEGCFLIAVISFLLMIGFKFCYELGMLKVYFGLLGTLFLASLLLIAIGNRNEAKRVAKEKSRLASMSSLERELESYIQLCRDTNPGQPDPTMDDYLRVIRSSKSH